MRESSDALHCRLLLCADIKHTLGAADYALISFLVLALRARKELGEPLCAMLPNTAKIGIAERLWLGALYTRDSLDALARAADITILPPSAADAASTCSRSNFDARIGVFTSTSAAQQIEAPAPNYTALLNAPNGRRGGATIAFFQQMWTYLRALTASAPHAVGRKIAHAAAGRQHDEWRRPISVCLLLMQSVPGPLSMAAAAFPDELGLVLQTLRLAPAIDVETPFASSSASSSTMRLADASEAASACTYIYLSDLDGSKPVVPTFTYDAAAQEWRPHPSFATAAERFVALSLRYNLSCAVVNVLARPRAAVAAIAPTFEGIASRMGEPDFQVVHVRKAMQPEDDEEGQAAARFNTDSELSILARLNLRQRWLALRAPLFATDGITHWADTLLSMRRRAGRPSAVCQRPSEPLAVCDPAARLRKERCECVHFFRTICLSARELDAARGDPIDYVHERGWTSWAQYETADGEMRKRFPRARDEP